MIGHNLKTTFSDLRSLLLTLTFKCLSQAEKPMHAGQLVYGNEKREKQIWRHVSSPKRTQLCIPTEYTGHPRPIPSHVMVSSAMGLKLGVFRFLPTTHAKAHTKQIHSWSLRAMQHFTRVYLHVQITADRGGIRTWRTTVILIMGKTRRPPIWAPCQNKDGAGSAISRVYLWVKGCGMGPWLVLVSPRFRENVVTTCKIGSFLCSLDSSLQKNVIFLFFGDQISKWHSFEKRAIFDLLFTFLVTREKLHKIPSAHISNTYIHVFRSPYWLILPYQFWKKIRIYQIRFLFGMSPGVDSYSRYFGTINK